jgi:hypothetical protein
VERPRILVANGNDDVIAPLDDALTSAGDEVNVVHIDHEALRGV